MIDVQQHAGDSAAAVAADAATGSSLPPSSAAAAVHASRASAEVSRDGKVLEPAEGDAAAAARASSEGPMAGEGAGGGGGGAPSFSTALATWRAIALTELQKELDAQAVEVVDGQRESVVGRKRLAEQTREFRKLPDDADKPAATRTLLKAYQSEIDALTRRSKTSDSAFLRVYKLLAEAPDPYPLLDAAVDQAVRAAEARALEVETVRLREENAELKRQAGEAHAADERRRRAEQRAQQVEAKLDDLVKERVRAKELELHAQQDERLRNHEERERDARKEAAQLREQLKELHASNESTQARLVTASSRQDADVSARLAELDLIAGDLERANERVATVERRNEMLRAEIEGVRSGSEAGKRVRALEEALADAEGEAGRLMRALEESKAERSEARVLEQRRLEEATKELEALRVEAESLRERLRSQSDYDELKRELDIIKYVEFSADADEVRMPDPSGHTAGSSRTLESLLASKNRRLEDEATRLRVANEELEVARQGLQRELDEQRAAASSHKALAERLEEDLARAGVKESSKASGGLKGIELESSSSSSPASPSILPIVTSQRDRFRQRNAELEEELRKQAEGVADLRAEIKALQADNLKLYEKVRYTQAYQAQQTSTRDEEMGRYKDRYEESMNPFEAFKGRESLRAIQALNPLERGVFALTRAVVGNRRARSLFILYAGSLHVLVFWVLWTCSGGGQAATPVIPMEPIRGK